jgi:hypothetical protein
MLPHVSMQFTAAQYRHNISASELLLAAKQQARQIAASCTAMKAHCMPCTATYHSYLPHAVLSPLLLLLDRWCSFIFLFNPHLTAVRLQYIAVRPRYPAVHCSTLPTGPCSAHLSNQWVGWCQEQQRLERLVAGLCCLQLWQVVQLHDASSNVRLARACACTGQRNLSYKKVSEMGLRLGLGYDDAHVQPSEANTSKHAAAKSKRYLSRSVSG